MDPINLQTVSYEHHHNSTILVNWLIEIASKNNFLLVSDIEKEKINQIQIFTSVDELLTRFIQIQDVCFVGV